MPTVLLYSGCQEGLASEQGPEKMILQPRVRERCPTKLIDLINSPLHLSPLPRVPWSSSSAVRARVPLGREVCFGPISITHLAEQRGRGASGCQAVINCLFGLLLSPRWRIQDSSCLGLSLGWLMAGRGVSLHILPPLSPRNPCPGHLGRNHGRIKAPSVHFDKKWFWPAILETTAGCSVLGTFSKALRVTLL